MSTDTEAPADWKVMPGTEGTGEYRVLARSPRGRLGIRLLKGQVRVRIEPIDGNATTALSEHFMRSDGWKQPGDDEQFRFSLVIPADEAGMAVVEQALKALASGSKLERDTTRRLWRSAFR